MTSFGMEWNLKSPLQWEWENQGLFSGRENEICISRPVQRTEWSEREGMTIVNGSAYSVPGCAFSGSELGNDSSRSSISASIDSSSKGGGPRTSGINFEAVKGFSKGLDKNNDLARVEDTGTSPVVAPTYGLGEPLIGLKLGKRTYFEDVCAGNSTKSSASLTSAAPSAASVKKNRLTHQSTPSSRCRVEGCNVDLSGVKDYHRKHRVCESHSKCPKVVVDGHERRFCQQCSRFHDLSDFDQKKRSCRRRLSDHNARRRKPQTDTISFTSSRLSSSFYDDTQQMNYLLRAPFGLMRSIGSPTWEDSGGFSITHSKGPWIKSPKAGGIDGQLQFSSSNLGNAVQTLPHDLEKLLPLKGTTAEVLSQGIEASVPAPNLGGAPDLRRALSLLSTDSWGSVNSGQPNLAHFANTSHNGAVHPAMMHTANTTSGYLLDQQTLPQQERVLPFNTFNNGSQYQEFQLSKTPYESPFFDSGDIISKSDGHFLEFKT